MSIHESFENANFDELFQGLVESNQLVDQGIMSFEKRMIDTQEDLTKKLAGTKGPYASIMQDVEDELNDDWRFHEATAEVSGRIYLADSSFEELVPVEWGKSQIDDNGEIFYYVEGVRLKSHGIEAIPEFDSYNEDNETEGQSVVGIKIGYSFADSEDQFDRPIYTANPGELIKHEYSMVTPEEAEVRLRHLWPNELARCEALLKPDAKSPAPQRITALCRFLQDIIKHDEEFSKLFEIYVNAKLELDSTHPYIMTAENALNTFEGDDLYDEQAHNQWAHMIITGPLTFVAHDPRIHITPHTDGSVRAHVLVATYNAEGGDVPEYVSVSTENITQFRPTRATQSIAARAITGLFDNAQGSLLQQAGAGISEVELSEGQIETVREDSGMYNKGRRAEELEQLRSLKNELELIAKEIRKSQSVVYSTMQDATYASGELLLKIRSRLNDTGLTTAHVFEVSGDQVLTPRFLRDPEIADKYPASMFVAVDPENPVDHIANGDSISGTIDSFQPLIKAITDKDDVVNGYMVNPSVLLEPPQGKFKKSVLSWQGASLIDATIDTRAIVPLDGSAEIKLVALDTLEGVQSSFDALKKEYGRDSGIVRKVHKLIRAFASEDKSEYVTLMNPKIITSVGVEMENMSDAGMDVNKALEAMSSLLIDRNLHVSGEVYNAVNGEITSRIDLARNQVVAGYVVDVRNDVWPGRPVIVLQSSGADVYYAPLDGLKLFRF